MSDISTLQEKAVQIWKESLLVHKRAPETRIASSLSCIEIFVSLYYGGLLNHNPKDPLWESRDRMIISKGHGSICMYPLLADRGYFDKSELEKVCQNGSFLGGIPDPIIPGYETVNGSLGHGLGVGCGIAVGLKAKKSDAKVFVLVGDGELNEGSNWEALMFAAHHKLDNLIVIVDDNKISMLDYSKKIIDSISLDKKFEAFGFQTTRGNGHDIQTVLDILGGFKDDQNGKPKVFLADTIKGRNVPQLEGKSLSHILSVKADDIDQLIKEA